MEGTEGLVALCVLFGLPWVAAWLMSGGWLGFVLWYVATFYLLVGLVSAWLRVRPWIIAAPFLLVQWLWRRRYRTLHGSARWATIRERQRWLDNDGQIHVGIHRDLFGRERALTVDGSTGHVACIGMTGGGKTSSLFLPSLLSLTTSCVVWDWKGTLFAGTAGYRKRILGQKVVRFAPAEQISARFNFLSTIRLHTDDEILDARLIMTALAEGEGPVSPDARHWEDTAVGLLVGVCLFVCYCAREQGTEASLTDVANALADPAMPTDQLFEAMGHHPHPFIRRQGQKNKARNEREESSIVSTAQRHVEPFELPAVARNTASSDFTLEELSEGDSEGRAVTMYLSTAADVAEAMAPVLRTFLAVLCKRLQCRDLRQKPRHRVTFCLDEFSALGHCSALAAATPRLREYGVTLVFGVQSLKDFNRLYGYQSNLLSNCSVKAVYTVGDLVDAEFVSKTLGIETRVWRHRSQTMGEHISSTSGRQYLGRAMMSPDEVLAADPARMWLFEAGRRPVYGWKIRPWEKDVFLARTAVDQDETTSLPAAANDNPYPAVPIPAAAKVAAVLALVALPLGSWGGLHALSAAAPPVSNAVGAAAYQAQEAAVFLGLKSPPAQEKGEAGWCHGLINSANELHLPVEQAVPAHCKQYLGAK